MYAHTQKLHISASEQLEENVEIPFTWVLSCYA